MINKIRILNIDDSAFVRKMLKDIFSSDKDFILIEQARNGKEALDILSRSNFDVITLDVEMPIMNGLETLQAIMDKKPTPVVMLSTKTSEGASTTMDALNFGAVDFITKPTNIFSADAEKLGEEIIKTVKNASKVNVKTPYFREIERTRQDATKKELTRNFTRFSDLGYGFSDKVKTIIAIGTSTGGPRALNQVIPEISQNINAAVLVVQHMPAGFTKSLAERLDSISKLKVTEAKDKEILKNGHVYVAPGGKQMKLRAIGADKYEIYLDDENGQNGHKPSVDIMMNSVCDLPIKNVVSVIMTGMGGDGAKGLERLKIEKNAVTIAQDKDSCVVYGMPKVAVETGKVDKVVPLNTIAVELNRIMGV